VNAPLAAVVDFHRRPTGLRLLSPPPIVVRLLGWSDLDGSGHSHGSSALMRFTIGIGPARVPWTARIEWESASGFTDRMIAGPFASWTHRHRFVSLGANLTEIRDEITAELLPELAGGLLGRAIWSGLPILFAYRRYRTRQLLQAKEVGVV
jgi:ligand-binding SRPBCC domain-containing protein